MTIGFSQDRAVPVLTLQGRLDARGAAEFEAACHELPAACSHVVLDFSRVDYISSIGIGALFKLEKSLRQRQGRAVLAALPPFVAKVLGATGVLGQFEQAAGVSGGVEVAMAGMKAAGASTEHTIAGRHYRLTPGSAEPCILEWWGEAQQAPDGASAAAAMLQTAGARQPVETTLDELGFAFGRGGFGNAGIAAQALGKFVAAGNFAGVLASDAHPVADFVLADRPEEVELAISAGIGFCGAPAFTVDVSAEAPAALGEILADVAGLVDSGARGMGFVMQVMEPVGMLLVGIFGPGPERLPAHAIVYGGAPTLAPKLEDLAGVAAVDAATVVESGSIWVYLPGQTRLGADKRLRIELEGDGVLEEEWREILRRLYHDCSRVILTPLAGGYNAKTFRVVSYDRQGRRLLPTVVKIGMPEMIRREEEAHRAYVQRFILNNSTSIMGTAAAGAWSALRYNFVGMAGPESRLNWLLDYYLSRPTPDVLAVLHRLYTQILKPWYGQPRWEPVDLYRDHSPLGLFPNLCEHAERDFGFSPHTDTIACAELGIELPNPFRFLRTEYPKRAGKPRLWYQAIGHGDLNLKNVLVDERENLYVLDFSETRPRNIVSDFARMESILKFQIVRLQTEDDLARLVEFEQGLADVDTLADVPPNRYRGTDAEVAKAYAVICRLRAYANTVTLFETDMEPYWLALLEWTYPVLSWDEPPLRRKFAAYSAGILCGRIA